MKEDYAFIGTIDTRGRIQIPKKTLAIIEDREASFKIVLITVKGKELPT
jgi:hypothetical protein